MTAALLAFVFQTDNCSSSDDSGAIRTASKYKGSGDPKSKTERPDGPSDEYLVSQIQQGRQEAFNILVKRYHVRLVATAEVSLGGLAEAEDIVQDILLKIWVNHKSWNPTHGAAVYLFGSLTNRIRNVWRDRRRMDRSLEVVREESQVSTESTAEDIATIWDEVANLPERWRIALTLRYLNDWTFVQVGMEMHISENAAKKIVQRAISALNDALSKKNSKN